MTAHSATRKSIILGTREYVQQLQERERILRSQLVTLRIREEVLNETLGSRGIPVPVLESVGGLEAIALSRDVETIIRGLSSKTNLGNPPEPPSLPRPTAVTEAPPPVATRATSLKSLPSWDTPPLSVTISRAVSGPAAGEPEQCFRPAIALEAGWPAAPLSRPPVCFGQPSIQPSLQESLLSWMAQHPQFPRP
jgi:hypothetical protein